MTFRNWTDSLNENINEYDNVGPSTPKVYIVKNDGTYKEAPIGLLSKISNLTYDMGGGETNYYPGKNIVIVDNIPVEEFAKEPGDVKGEKVYVEYNLNNSTSLPKASKIIASQLVYHLDNHEAFAQTVANSLKDGGTFEFQSDKMNKKDKMFLQHLSDEYGFGLPTKLNQYKQEPLPLKKGEFVEPIISYIYKITDKDGKTATLSTTKKGNSWEWKKIDGDIDFKTGGWSKPPEDPDPDFRAKEYTLRSFNKYLSYFGDSNTIVDFEKLNEANKPYKHKHGFDDKLGKDPFGLNAYARELVNETFKKSVTIDMGPILKALEFKMPTGQETDENVLAIIDSAPQGTVPHPVFLDFYAKFDKYFGEENDSRMLDNFGLEYLLSKVLNLSNEDIQTVINHYNTTDQDSVEWFEQHDNELEKEEEWNVDGFDPTQDNLAAVNQYLSKNKKLHESDPKKGTGKKPEGSGRRLYTDEDPSDTVSIEFRTKEDIVNTLNKTSFKNKPHARQSQIINLIHQRVRAAYQNAKDAKTKARLKRGLDYIEKRKEASKKKTQRLKKQKLKESTKSDFNRVLYYQNYFTNLSPSTFDINIVEDDIMISGINKPYLPEFNDTIDTRQVPVNQNLEENIDPKSQKKHKGKSAPFGSAYEPVDEGDTYEKMAAKGKKAGNLKQGTVRKRLGIPKDKKIPLSLINKEIARLKKMDKDPDKKGAQLGDKNQKYYKALQLAKTLKTTTNLNEGRYDTLANKLSSIAFKAFKDIHDRGDKGGSFKFRVDHPEDEHDIPSEEFYFDFEGVVEITDDEYNVDGGANAGFDTKGNEVTPLLSVKFKIPKNPDWQEVSFNIKDVVRHELEHLTQDGENEKGGAWHEDPKLRRPSKYMEDDQLIRNLIDAKLLPKSQYFKLEKEIDAMLQGLYFKAKKSKRPFKDVINTYLNIFLDQETITQEEKENILDIWRSRAKSLSLPLFESKSISDLYTVYLDMDGVIADFDKRFTELAGMGPREYESSFGREKFWDFIDNKIGVKFWTGIEWMPEGKKLYNFVKQFDHKLLSAPSRNDTSKIGKRMWVEKNTPGTQLILAAAVNKQNYADKSNILIDDRESNIQQWKDAGGIGILFKSTDQVIDELKKIMNL